MLINFDVFDAFCHPFLKSHEGCLIPGFTTFPKPFQVKNGTSLMLISTINLHSLYNSMVWKCSGIAMYKIAIWRGKMMIFPLILELWGCSEKLVPTPSKIAPVCHLQGNPIKYSWAYHILHISPEIIHELYSILVSPVKKITSFLTFFFHGTISPEAPDGFSHGLSHWWNSHPIFPASSHLPRISRKYHVDLHDVPWMKLQSCVP